jgi:hypothetical protein
LNISLLRGRDDTTKYRDPGETPRGRSEQEDHQQDDDQDSASADVHDESPVVVCRNDGHNRIAPRGDSTVCALTNNGRGLASSAPRFALGP